MVFRHKSFFPSYKKVSVFYSNHLFWHFSTGHASFPETQKLCLCDWGVLCYCDCGAVWHCDQLLCFHADGKERTEILKVVTGTKCLINVVRRAIRDNNDLSASAISRSLQVMKQRDLKKTFRWLLIVRRLTIRSQAFVSVCLYVCAAACAHICLFVL